MLIRNNQMRALADQRTAAYESDVADHLKRCFPKECETLGEDGTRETIRFGICRARDHGITAKREVCMYIDLMVVQGRDFDSEPWASEVLNGRRWKDPSAKIAELFRRANQNTGRSGGGTA